MKSLAQISVVALGIFMASAAQSQVLFSFEEDLHGFYGGSSILSQDTVGATHGSYSMRVEWPGGFDWLFAGSKPGITALLNQNRKILLDITVPEGGNPTPWSNMAVSFNDPLGWRQTYTYGVQTEIPTAAGTRTVMIDCSALTPPAPNSEWFQFNIAVNAGGGPNVIYYDNIRLLDEAATLPAMSFEEDLHGYTGGSSILSQDTVGATHGSHSMRVEWPGGFDWLFGSNVPGLTAKLNRGHIMVMDVTIPEGGNPTPWSNFAVSFNDPLGWRQTYSYGVQGGLPTGAGTFTVAIDLGGLTPPAENSEWFQLNIAVNAGSGPNVVYIDNIRILRDNGLGDVNGDGCVDDVDLLAILFAFGNTSGPEDLNVDGSVDDIDLLEVLFNFGNGC